jgi:hypothetical protein
VRDRLVIAATTIAMIVTLLAGCSTDQPAVCNSLDAVRN